MKFCDGKLPREVEGLNSYLNCIAEADRQIGRLIDGIKSRGLADDTLIVITGDHGEAFEWPHDVSGHGLAVYQECVNVPCMFWNPRLFPTGSRLHTVGGHIDLNPTILDILQLQRRSAGRGEAFCHRAARHASISLLPIATTFWVFGRPTGNTFTMLRSASMSFTICLPIPCNN